MLRLIDANLNRISEGLRLLEDVARFILNDAALSAALKSLRHELLGEYSSFQKELLSARDSAQDVAAFAEEQMSRTDLPAIVTANARRVEESLRVLEEISKLPDLALDPVKFKQARFALYELERALTGKITRREKRIAGLYVIIDPEVLGGRDGQEVCRQAIRGGAKAIQLRDKKRSRAEILAAVQKLKEVCAQHDVPFILNDYLDIALAAGADGLHLGQGDLPVSVARRLLPIDKILGCSTTTLEEALQAEADGADYIAVGAIYPTPSKTGAIVVGLERFCQIREAISLPIVAIGGIDEENAPAVVEAGADAIAVISALWGAADVEEAARKLAERMEVK
ncbi:MAG: thiamine phosphate synthase [Dehalococcoidia bacterium]|nr:thiamine phosphate synthase [Dehalococcoidia bacterium]